MTSLQKKRMLLVTVLLFGLGTALALVLYALSQNINLFYTPTQISENAAPSKKQIRVGGMVVVGSVVRSNYLKVEFVVTDFANSVKIEYQGILPDLFREKQGVVVKGKIGANGNFIAKEVLAKHDENYMPPEAAFAVKQAEKANKKLGNSNI